MKNSIDWFILVLITLGFLWGVFHIINQWSEAEPIEPQRQLTEEERLVMAEGFLNFEIEKGKYLARLEVKWNEIGERKCGKENYDVIWWGGEPKKILCLNYSITPNP